MSKVELQAIHDEIWRQIFHRQKCTLQSEAKDECSLKDDVDSNGYFNQRIFAIEDRFSESEHQPPPV